MHFFHICWSKLYRMADKQHFKCVRDFVDFIVDNIYSHIVILNCNRCEYVQWFLFLFSNSFPLFYKKLNSYRFSKEFI